MVVEIVVIVLLIVIATLPIAGFLLWRRSLPSNPPNTEADGGEVNETYDELAKPVSKDRAIKGGEADFRKGEVIKRKSLRGRRRVISRSLERKIIAMYKAGKSPKEIAEALGISKSSVYRRVRKVLKA